MRSNIDLPIAGRVLKLLATPRLPVYARDLLVVIAP